MKKVKSYYYVKFGAEILNDALELLVVLGDEIKEEFSYSTFTVEQDDSEWTYDSKEEFFSDYRKYNGGATLRLAGSNLGILVIADPLFTHIEVSAPKREYIERLYELFEKNKEKYTIENPVEESDFIVFIGHGHSEDWRDVKDHLHHKHDIQIEAYETGARAGQDIINVLSEMTKKSSFAILVMTAEDEQENGSLRARQNVVHELGLFQGKLGFSRAVILMEEGVEDFSNIAGIQQIRYKKNNIKETFGEILATIKREFG